jgi:preprotein translocase subunit SecG
MAILSSLLTLVQVIAALAVIVLVLLQQGKGADMGAAFGGGSSGSLFGASGSANFLSRMTALAALVFFVSTLGLSFMANQGLVARSPSSELEKRLSTGVTVKPVDPAAAPAAPAGAPAAPAAPAAAPANSGAAPAKTNEIPK